MVEQCFRGICFFPLSPDAPEIFVFSEFLAGLALMVLAWTIADVRYRFRVMSAPIPLVGLTFGVVATVGTLTLLTDLWRAEGWLVPRGNLLTSASWQAILAGVFLLTFLSWAWFALIKPPKFGRRNTKRLAQALYRFILRGSPLELAVIADELSHSAEALVHNATDRDQFKGRPRDGDDQQPHKLLLIEAYANDLLLLIADKRFCRAIVESSPITALAIFEEMGKQKKYGIQVETFAKNIVNQALANKDSFLFHEAEGYESGLIGYHKPLSHAMFSNCRMVESVGTMLDPEVGGDSKWEADQWKAYCRLVLMTFQDYVDKQFWSHSYTLYRAKGYIERSIFDLYTLNGVSNTWNSDPYRRLCVVVNFIKDTIAILDEKGVPTHIRLRMRDNHTAHETFYDHIASMIFEVIFSASVVTSPQWECWNIQHNSIWGELFNYHHLDNPAGKVVKFKLRRLLYNEISDMKRFPNFKGAGILGFCLNVMGLDLSRTDHEKDSFALHKAILAWTKKNYTWLYAFNPRVAEACLVDGITYDANKSELIKTYPAEGLRRKPAYVTLDIDPLPANPIS